MHRTVLSACAALLLCGTASVSAQSREEFVLSEGYVMSFDPETRDLPQGDVHVRDGAIVAVGEEIEAPGVERIDVAGKLVMPGLVDTHTHLWTSAMKGWFQNTDRSRYFDVKEHFGRHYMPQDVRIGTYFGAVETLSAGITTTVDFFHNNRGPDFFEASLQALRDSGLRTRLLYGAHDDTPDGETVDLEHLGTLAQDWQDERVTLGFGWRGAGDGSDERLETSRREIEFVREAGLPISVHASGEGNGPLAESGLVGEDTQVIHATGATSEQLRAFEEAGASLALTPVTEQRVGYGLINLSDFEPMSRVGLGIDSPSLAGSADLFANMRLLGLNETGAAQEETVVEPRRLLEMATIEAARSLGMEEEIGSVTVGKRADLIVLDLQALNLAPLPEGDPAALIVYSAQPANVDMVMVDGTILKRDGELLDVDVPAVLADVEQSIEGIVERAGGWPEGGD